MHPRHPLTLLVGAPAALALLALTPVRGTATDVDGPDCQSTYQDFGDAPESIPAYPNGVVGHFPTCLAFSPAGTQELDCPAVSTPPGVTGYVLHRGIWPAGANFWLGCYPGPQGVDSDPDGKVALLPQFPGCLQGSGDCLETAFGSMTFAQDECFGDGSDAGLTALPSLVACSTAQVDYATYNCGSRIQVFLNILVDWNEDGDWNDVIRCNAAICAPEWAVKNFPVFIDPGCTMLTSPSFTVGPKTGPTWLRITISYNPVNDDFPWAGWGGETEDYPLTIVSATPTWPHTWGRLKIRYRS